MACPVEDIHRLRPAAHGQDLDAEESAVASSPPSPADDRPFSPHLDLDPGATIRGQPFHMHHDDDNDDERKSPTPTTRPPRRRSDYRAYRERRDTADSHYSMASSLTSDVSTSIASSAASTSRRSRFDLGRHSRSSRSLSPRSISDSSAPSRPYSPSSTPLSQSPRNSMTFTGANVLLSQQQQSNNTSTASIKERMSLQRLRSHTPPPPPPPAPPPSMTTTVAHASHDTFVAVPSGSRSPSLLQSPIQFNQGLPPANTLPSLSSITANAMPTTPTSPTEPDSAPSTSTTATNPATSRARRDAFFFEQIRRHNERLLRDERTPAPAVTSPTLPGDALGVGMSWLHAEHYRYGYSIARPGTRWPGQGGRDGGGRGDSYPG